MSAYTDDDVRALARAFHGKAFFPEPGEFADGLAAKILDHLIAAGWAKRADVQLEMQAEIELLKADIAEGKATFHEGYAACLADQRLLLRKRAQELVKERQ